MASGRLLRLLTLIAVLCAIGGLVLAANAMPMVASETPGSSIFDDESDGSTAGGLADRAGEGDLANDTDRSLDTAEDSSGASQTGSDEQRTGVADRGSGVLDDADGGSTVGAALYGLASVVPGVDGLSSDTGGTGGEFDAVTGTDGAGSMTGQSDTIPDDELEFDDGSLAEYEYDPSGSLSEIDAEPEQDGDDSGTESGFGDGEETTADGETTEGQLSNENTTAGTDSSGEGVPNGEMGSNGTDGDPGEDGTAQPEDNESATANSEGDGGDGGTGPTGLMPDVSTGTLTALIAGVLVVALAYVFYTRDAPLETLMAIPGRLATAVINGVVALSRRLERAVSRIREVTSVRQLPGLVVTAIVTIRNDLLSWITGTVPQLGGFDGRTDDLETDTLDGRISPRERVQAAFDTVIEASTIGGQGVDTVTPVRIARNAKRAGAPAEPVDRITRSFRDVEYGGYDADTYLEETARAHDRLRSALTDTGTESDVTTGIDADRFGGRDG